ncbi:hypothetical protein [Enterococcus faecium]|uniref:hypothetical protein n=1 Tax=Enterococcus faecium TaxID=1352 RepID=UPI001E4B8F1E|nr:hypothetical protein [Enterococcus faecium]
MKKMAGRFYSADYAGLTGNIYEWSCDKSLVAAPFSNKRCSRDSLSAIRLNISVTTSPLNGVQKLASAVISPTKRKIGRTIFVWLFLLLDAGQFFHDLFFV